MLFMLVSKTRADLSKHELSHLGEIAKQFYANIPPNVSLHGDWGAIDGSQTFALIEADDESVIERLQLQFRPYVDMEITAVRTLSGWEIS